MNWGNILIVIGTLIGAFGIVLVWLFLRRRYFTPSGAQKVRLESGATVLRIPRFVDRGPELISEELVELWKDRIILLKLQHQDKIKVHHRLSVAFNEEMGFLLGIQASDVKYLVDQIVAKAAAKTTSDKYIMAAQYFYSMDPPDYKEQIGYAVDVWDDVYDAMRVTDGETVSQLHERVILAALLYKASSVKKELAAVSKTQILFRGLFSEKTSSLSHWNDWIRDHRGTIVMWPSIVSATGNLHYVETLGLKYAPDFAIIQLRGVPMSLTPIYSKFANEGEIVLPFGGAFRVIGTDNELETLHIVLQYVGTFVDFLKDIDEDETDSSDEGQPKRQRPDALSFTFMKNDRTFDNSAMDEETIVAAD